MANPDLTSDQKTQVEKLLVYIQKMETIVRTTSNDEQRSRIKKELLRYLSKIDGIIPGINATQLNAAQIRNVISGGTSVEASSATSETTEKQAPVAEANLGEMRVIDKLKLEKASENCTDPDLNLLSSLFKFIDQEYWPTISDRHIKLDFSNAAERDGVRQTLDNVLRNLEVLAETIEEFASAEKQDFREQLLKMKNRQSRTFIYESNEALKKIKAFIRKLAEDVNQQGGIIMNKAEIIKFNSKYENATMLNGYQIKEAVIEFYQLIDEGIEELNLPQMKIKQK